MHTGNGTIQRATQPMKNLVLTNFEDRIDVTESVHRAIKVMRFMIQTLKKPFKLCHGRRQEPNCQVLYKRKLYLSEWSYLF